MSAEQSANERYAFLETELKMNMKILQQKLINHSRKQKANIRNYGFVGDIAYINGKIKEINSFLE